MKTLLALVLVVATSSVLAVDRYGPVSPRFDGPIPGQRDPLEVTDPLMQPPATDTPLPDLGSSGGADWFKNERPRELPQMWPPAVDPLSPRSEQPGAPWYWQEQPLYTPPVP